MKSIIVAIDFQHKIISVLNIAKKMAKAFGAKLYIVHSEIVGPEYVNSVIQVTGQQPSMEIINQQKILIEKRLSEIHKDLLKAKIKSECVFMEGPTIENILDEAEKVKAEIIIIGSHEHGKFYHLIFGSTHNLLIKKSTIPVLIIPPHIKE